MATLAAKWLPGGSVELAPMPYLGQHELTQLSEREAEVKSILARQIFLKFGTAILAAEKTLKGFDARQAKESWDDYILLEFGDIPLLRWDEEVFADNLRIQKERFLFRQLRCSTDEEAKAALSSEAASLAEAIGRMDKGALKDLGGRPLLALYWRLRGSGITQILTPGGPMDIDWSLERKDAALALLGQVTGPEDPALKVLWERPSKPFDMEALKPHTAADVLGKAETPSVPLSGSTPASGPSSSPTTAIA